MHYNQFTIGYLELLSKYLSENPNNSSSEKCIASVKRLKEKLEALWVTSHESIEIVQDKFDSTIQSGLFGHVYNLDYALKTGYILSDRIVLLDFLYERVLKKKSPEEVDIDVVNSLAISLEKLLPLAREGRLIIIPTPFSWHPDSKAVIEEVSKKTTLTHELMSMLNMLSVAKLCNINPFTISESEEKFNTIIKSHLDHVDELGRVTGDIAYKSILGALVTEQLIRDTELKFVENIPIERYAEVINANDNFYQDYQTMIHPVDVLNTDSKLESVQEQIVAGIKLHNPKTLKKAIKIITSGSVAGAATIAVVGAVGVISAPLTIAGVLLGVWSQTNSVHLI